LIDTLKVVHQSSHWNGTNSYFWSFTVNRFMVGLGLGSLMLSACLVTTSFAEMPALVRSATTVQPADPIVWHESLESGWKESRRRGVPMVIYITSDNCHYCEAMKRDTWCDESIRQQLSEFVAIRLTPNKNSETLDRIKLKMFPATLIGVPQGKIVDQHFGYQPPAQMHGILRKNHGSSRVLRK
jgi:Thioredoxin-like